jgi:hypothetical protein
MTFAMLLSATRFVADRGDRIDLPRLFRLSFDRLTTDKKPAPHGPLVLPQFEIGASNAAQPSSGQGRSTRRNSYQTEPVFAVETWTLPAT